MNSMADQLTLGVQLKDNASFANFYPGDNQEALQALMLLARQAEPGFVFLWGGVGSGKSHLLQALCHEAGSAGGATVYLPLRDAPGLSCDILSGLESISLVCLDDVESIVGSAEWEEAIFHLYNRIQMQGGRLVITASGTPSSLNFHLPDLVSRLTHGLIYRLQCLDDEQKGYALQQRATFRGFALPEEVLNYLLKRAPRSVDMLFELFDRLDQASLAAKRKLTIPFVRSFLEKERKA
ncbi:MAG: DnaA regulatory inactivator Hda [Gammaproteobacteria bacterium]|nr:DnaA regulatory inactivator Hda [Gammaproteobacteria bacterium]MCF6231010.1 DnaA regulatory inactivator Hda [Gammaproteobacteria bacterium]